MFDRLCVSFIRNCKLPDFFISSKNQGKWFDHQEYMQCSTTLENFRRRRYWTHFWASAVAELTKSNVTFKCCRSWIQGHVYQIIGGKTRYTYNFTCSWRNILHENNCIYNSYKFGNNFNFSPMFPFNTN